ncbi:MULTISPECIES: GGDEF domain-containing protein [unclassified Burkholderia]|uniref:GGDEF domain-containing protein n=1 Tax=unclassified Burkholderia TaxID=2613784 RepID=UPI00141E3E8B|nr:MULTISPECIES: GGDEF domain-containing protein [unclassified Burkholderia]NIE55267.1 GGDEF domain-containing protein [Burkholderia sp. Ap-955]NIF08166.1 GGDEF domain-containing protein [Burkholderia sp. Ax-1735]NIG01197.1 GGDEF domain-containing protein [Burkholderia sp. Tr-849]
MTVNVATQASTRTAQLVTRVYARLLLVGFALAPGYLIAYLYFFQDPSLRFENHAFHELAIAAATLEGAFVTYVCWRCYRLSGEPLLRWLTLGFLGFSVIYALHGAFTGMAHHNIWLFLLYGPASRLTMSILILVGQLTYSHKADSATTRANPRIWLPWLALFGLVDVAVAVIAYSPVAGHPWVRLSMEGGALLLSAVNVIALVMRRIRSPLMTIYGISVTAFALSSLAFILGRPWNHMWWLAHAIFAAGFFLLSFGVVQAFQTTRSFSKIYSQEELFARLREAMARTEHALQALQRTNEKLEHLAATDPLTGATNRRQFIESVQAEINRAKRHGAPFSLLALDLDHFKAINDSYGHQAGDQVLQRFVNKCADAIRPYDGVARMGGEEFMVLLPQAALDTARSIGERIRAAIADAPFEAGVGEPVKVTVSVGASEFGRDGETIDAILRKADERLYRAKHQGRNRVVAG